MKPLFFFLVTVCLPAIPMAWGGPRFEPLAAFQAGGTGPESGPLHVHTDGFRYGTTRSGGAFGHGTLYRVSAAGEMEVLVHFSGTTGSAKGRRPQSGLIDGGDAALWGTTFQGGQGNLPDGFGTVYRFHPGSRELTTVVQFTGVAGNAKGSFPQAALERDGSGTLWGTTTTGGANGAGTVFKVHPATYTFTPVLDFSGASGDTRGKNPQADLVWDGAGSLWGTTMEGGSGSVGTLFRVEAASGTLTTLLDFTGGSGAFPGGRPMGGLFWAADGVLWGTASGGGAGGHGTVFSYQPTGNNYQVRAEFTGTGGAARGRQPASALVPDGAGQLLGTTNGGGPGDHGTIFRIHPGTSVFTSLMTFTGINGNAPGVAPSGGLVPDGAGSFWGTTRTGGLSRLGNVFKFHGTTAEHEVVADFQRTVGPVGASAPQSGLATAPDGWLWGTSQRGGMANGGMIFRMDPATGVTEKVVEFTGSGGDVPGADPSTELVAAPDGAFWGTTLLGGSGDQGTVYKISPVTRVFTVVAAFNGTNGRNPIGRLVADGQGFFWGTTAGGGQFFNGTVFKISQTTGELTTVVHFTGSGEAFVGDEPAAGLTPDGNGFMWGTTYEGGANNQGNLFKIAIATGAFTPVFEFTGMMGAFKGTGPSAPLTLDAAGFLWGTTAFGGKDDSGTVFKIHRDGTRFATVVEFTGKFGDRPGLTPKGGLMQDPLGAWYGTTEAGGTLDMGILYRIRPDGGFQTLFEFTGLGGNRPGTRPRGEFWRHTDGHFYATTSSGGAINESTPAGNGQIYRLRFGPVPVTGASSGLEPTTATVHATVDPNGAAGPVTFEYSTDPGMANPLTMTAGMTTSGNVPESRSAVLPDLTHSTVYYYRVKASNPENLTPQYGAIATFTTPKGTDPEPDGFAEWLEAANIPGGAAAVGLDADNDGTANGIEFILGTDPASADAPPAPTLDPSASPGMLLFRFSRQDASETPDVLLTVEAGPGLGAWPMVWTVAADTASSSSGVQIGENGDEPDLVTVSIPSGTGDSLFVRLNVRILP